MNEPTSLEPYALTPEGMAESKRLVEEVAATLGITVDELLNRMSTPGGAVLEDDELPKP